MILIVFHEYFLIFEEFQENRMNENNEFR